MARAGARSQFNLAASTVMEDYVGEFLSSFPLRCSSPVVGVDFPEMEAQKQELHTGYLPEREEGIARAAVEDLDTDELWRRFVSVRRPVLIDGLAQDDSWAGQRWVSFSRIGQITIGSRG